MKRDHVLSNYRRLVNDIDFEKLELGLDRQNIFKILSIETNELRHSNMLAWLLNPMANHKLGAKVLKKVLRQIFSSQLSSDLSPVDAEGIDFNSVQIAREWQHIDLLISTRNTVIAIENKVFSKEHSNQLRRYRTAVEKHFPNHKHIYVFLTPDGEPPETEVDYYEPLSYEFIADTLSRILDTYSDSIDDRTKIYLRDYIQTIKRDIMKNDEMTDLAQQIYSNHKEIIDFIINNRPDELSRLRDTLSEKILARGWSLGSPSSIFVRFIPETIQPLLYTNRLVKNGWKYSESFLFEIRLSNKVNKLVFKTVIAPSDPTYETTELEAMMLEIEGSKPSKGKQWLVNFTEHYSLDFDNLAEMTELEMSEEIDKFLNKITPIVSAVESKLLEKRDACLNLKRSAEDKIDESI